MNASRRQQVRDEFARVSASLGGGLSIDTFGWHLQQSGFFTAVELKRGRASLSRQLREALSEEGGTTGLPFALEIPRVRKADEPTSPRR